MPRLSQRASELVRDLWRERARPALWRLEVMRALTALKEPNAAPYILAEYLGSHDLPAVDVAAMLQDLVGRCSLGVLLGMERERLESDFWYAPKLPEPLDRLNAFSAVPGGSAALAIASFSRNGYIRERAVRGLADLLHDGREIPFLALRTADYVPEVRRAATAALAARFTPEQAPSFVRVLPLLRHLDAHERWRLLGSKSRCECGSRSASDFGHVVGCA
jgi:hypothetical protein